MSKQPEISMVVPAFNEIQHIEDAIERAFVTLSQAASTFEIVVVDDGSKDGTYRKLQSLSSKYQCLKVVSNGSNMGKGFAVKRAAEYVTGASIVILDADLDIDTDHLRQYLKILKEYDLCIASKRHPLSSYKAPLIRKFLSIGFNKLTRLLTGVRFTDSQTGMKAVKGEYFKRIMRIISVKRFSFDVEMLAVAQLMGLRVAELPVRIEQGSAFGKRAIVYMLIDLLGIAYRLRLIKWYQKNLTNTYPEYKPIIRI